MSKPEPNGISVRAFIKGNHTITSGDTSRVAAANNEESSINSLKKRLTSLEIEHGILGNEYEHLREVFENSERKVLNLERQTDHIQTENAELRQLIGDMRQEFRGILKTFKNEIEELKKAGPVTRKLDKRPVGFKKSVIRHQTDVAPHNKNDRDESHEEEQPNLRKFASEDNNKFFESKNFLHSGSFSPTHEHEVEDKPYDFSVLEIPDSPSKIKIDAVNPKMNPYMNTETDLSLPPEEKLSRKVSAISGDGSPEDIGKSIKKSFIETNKTFDPKRLFENFLVIGTTRQDARDHVKKLQEKTSIKIWEDLPYDGKILFNFAESAGLSENVILPDIDKFLAPWHLLLNLHPDGTRPSEQIFFNIILKSQKKYTQKYVCPFQPHTGEIQLSKWDESVESINPQNKLYAICIKKSDFLVREDRRKKSTFCKIQTIYCFLTYYPITSLLFDALLAIANMTRVKRKEQFFKLFKQNRAEVDFEAQLSIFQKDVVEYLSDLMRLQIPGPKDSFIYNYYDGKSLEARQKVYEFPAESSAYLELATWEAYRTFQKFSLENIQFLLSAILLEKSLVFFSEDITTLTAALNTFLGLLFPFKYVCTLIPTLPSNLIRMLEAPVPIIIGINRDANYFWKKDLIQNSQCIFVFLDSSTIYADETNPDASKFPILEFITENIEVVHKKVNIDGLRLVKVFNARALNERIPNRKNGVFLQRSKNLVSEVWNSDPQNIMNIRRLFDHFRDKLEKSVVSYLPHFKDYNPAQTGEDEMTQKINNLIQNENVRKFFQQFKITQGFNSYPYSVSSCIKSKI